jgi:nicotinate-nucleotide adenylyltransferase
MLELAIAGQPSFAVDEMEKDRPGPSYTVDTLEELHRRYPADQLFLIIGSDSLMEMTQWRAPERIRELATLLVVGRPGWELEPAQGRSGRFQQVNAPLIEISSRDLRQRASEGRSLRYLVPPSVDCYITQHRLYRDAPTSG